jgi:hypothetical protein
VDPKADVVQYVKDHPGTNQSQIQKALKMGDRSVRIALSEARDEGLLKVGRGDGKELRWYDVENEDAVLEDLVKKLPPPSKPS